MPKASKSVRGQDTDPTLGCGDPYRRVDKLSEEIQLTENLFTEYSRVHSKCQILIQSGVEEDDAHSRQKV